MTEEWEERSIADQQLSDAAPYIVIATDAAGVIASSNPAAERTLGYTSGECVGKPTLLAHRDPREISERAATLTSELGAPIETGSKASSASPAEASPRSPIAPSCARTGPGSPLSSQPPLCEMPRATSQGHRVAPRHHRAQECRTSHERE